MNVKLATIERLALHKDHLKHFALINNPHLLRDLCPRESPIGSNLCRTPRQWQTTISRASPKTPAWSSSSFSPCIHNISHLFPSHLFIVRTITLIEYSALLSSSASCSRLFQGRESSPRCSSFSSFFAKSCLRSNCSPSLPVWTRPNKRTRRNTSIAFRSLFQLIMSCLLFARMFFLPSLVKYYITECHFKQAIFFLNHGAACNQRLQLKKWSQVGICQVPTDDQEARTTPGRKRRQVAGSPPR